MKNIKSLVRPNILALEPYSSARDEFSGAEGIFLDANENPFGKYNRYPDPYQKDLKRKLSLIKNIAVENIFIGNGSDEVIDVLLRIFCEPGQDEIIICPPTYGMYEVSANINNVNICRVPLLYNFQLNVTEIANVQSEKTKIIFLCSPNNPTGNSLENIDEILESFSGIVVVDEAYIDFSSQESYSNRLTKYPNLVVMQTFSKAWGLASARVGIAFAHPEILDWMNKVKPPYNVSLLNQNTALEALENQAEFEKQKQIILNERERLISEFEKLEMIKKIYPTDANFVLVEVVDANKIYNELVAQKVITRNRNSVVKNCIRITVGSQAENDILLTELKKIKL